jgi:hypothetical protein
VDKNEFVKMVKRTRKMLESDAAADCPCPKTKCEWHGRCYECVRIHRINGSHIPNCLQFMFKEKIKQLAEHVELVVCDKPTTPPEYWNHVNKVSPLKDKKRGKAARVRVVKKGRR